MRQRWWYRKMRLNTLHRRFSLGLLLALLLVTAPGAARGQTTGAIVRLADINRATVSSEPKEAVSLNGTLLFLASDSTANPDNTRAHQLWRSDGTAAGTRLLHEFPQYQYYPGVSELTVLGPAAYFVADSNSSVQLWRSDGTLAGTTAIADISFLRSEIQVLGGALYFFTLHPESGRCSFWKSDGTPTGTQRLVVELGCPVGEARSGGKLFYVLNSPDSIPELWVSTGGAPRFVVASGSGFVGMLTDVGGTLYYRENFDSLWKSDGTPAGTMLVKDFAPDDSYAEIVKIVAQKGSAYVSVYEANAGGTVLYRSSGTPGSTVKIAAIEHPREMVSVAGRLFFLGESGLWVSSGTPGSPTLLKALKSANSMYLFRAGATLFFAGQDAADPEANNSELWKSDGTSAGTVRVKNIRPAMDMPSPASNDPYDSSAPSGSSSPLPLLAVNETLYFSADDGMHGRELWKSNGTTAGTTLVKDAAPATDSAVPNMPTSLAGKTRLTDVAGTLFFSARNAAQGYELWKTSGAGATLVKDIRPGVKSSSPLSLTAVGATLFFTARDASGTRGLWKSDGTPAGTVLVKLVAAINLANVGGTLFFSAFDQANGVALWKSDGTPAGTVLVKDINPSSSAPDSPFARQIENLTGVGGTLYFAAGDGASGVELWKSDGTPAGTVRVKDVNPGPADSRPGNLRAVGGTLYFTARDSSFRLTLWRSDGTSAGTTQVSTVGVGSTTYASDNPALLPINGTLFFNGIDPLSGATGLWRSDGTSAGTFRLSAVAAFQESMANLNGLLIYAGNSPQGIDLWASDGTAEGTRLLKDLELGFTSVPLQLTTVGGRVYFVASDPAHGYELWQTDGTTVGTQLAQDIYPGAYSSIPSGLTRSGNRLFFSAYEPAVARELWVAAPAG